MPQPLPPNNGSNDQRLLDIEILLAKRELARRNYRDFLKYYVEVRRLPVRWSYYLDYLADILQAVASRQIKRAVVNIPPRHWKSTLISQLWQAWLIGRANNDHDSSMLSCAATATLATRDARCTMNVVRSDWYKALFPHVKLARENEVDWETTEGARRMAVGVGGTVTGRGANRIIWDDILLAQDAMSELVRSKTNEWLGEVLSSRLDDPKEGTVVGIMQRLHEMDPTGYLLEQAKIPGADQYEHICIPLEAQGKTVVEFNGHVYATREPNELIDSDRIGPKEVQALKISQRSNFEGQYNQNPIKMVGGHLDPRQMIESSWGPLEMQQHLGLTCIAIVDLAATEKEVEKDDPDESTISILSRDQFNRLAILDVWGGCVSHDVVANTLLAMHRLYKLRCARIEHGTIYNLFVPVLKSRMQASGQFLAYDSISTGGKDKITRSMSFQAMLNAGAVVIPKRARAPWLEKFEAQCRAFPRGRHDDRCLTSNTCVLSSKGWELITDIRAGDLVHTRRGLRRVLAAGQTGISRVIRRGPLIGTPNHPVWTENRGWIPLLSLSSEDVVVLAESPSSSTDVDTEGVAASAEQPSTSLRGPRLRRACLRDAEINCGTGSRNAPSALLTDCPVPVFNLTVEGEPEFFANGVLVHNCEGAFYAARDFDTLPKGEAPPTDSTGGSLELMEQQRMKERIQEAVDRETKPPDQSDGW